MANGLKLRILLRWVGILFGILFWQSAAAANTASPTAVRWYTDMDAGLKVMLKENRPGVVCFFLPGAQPVMQMQRETFTQEPVRQALADFVCVAVNLRDRDDLKKSYDIYRVPTILFLDSRGREIDRLVGFKPPSSFLQSLVRYREALKGAEGGAVSAFRSSAVDATQPATGRIAVQFNYAEAVAVGKQVSLVGDFNDWNPITIPMRDTGTHHTATVYLDPGHAYEYLYLVSDNVGHRTDPRNPWARANNFGTLNSVMLVGNVPQTPVVNGKKVLFTVYAPEARKVELAGSFTNWEMKPLFRNRNNPQLWGVQYELDSGRHLYKFIIDDEWTMDPENFRPAKEGDYYNNSFVVP